MTQRRHRSCLLNIKKDADSTLVRFLGIRIYNSRLCEGYISRRVCGIPLPHISQAEPGVQLQLDARNFHPVSIDNRVLLEKLRSMEPFTYIPDPGNLGDALLAASTLQFFDTHGLPYCFHEKNGLPENLVYGGGGIWCPYYQNFWQKEFLPLFRHAKKVLILPSSFWNCDALLRELDSRFTIFCREQQSYDYLQRARTGAETILDHDMALRLSSSVFHYDNREVFPYDLGVLRKIKSFYLQRTNVGFFLRRDRESIHTYGSDLDLSDTGSIDLSSSRRRILCCAAIFLSTVDSLDAVVTDRLHVGIAGMLMDKEVYLLDNSYKKVSSVYQHSFETIGWPKVHLVTKPPKSIHASSTASKNLEILMREVANVRI